MAPHKVLLHRRLRVLQGTVAAGMIVTCIIWIATALPGSLQPREVPSGDAYTVSTEGADGEIGASLIKNLDGDPVSTETVAPEDSGPDFVSMEEIQKNRTKSVEAIAKEMNLVLKKGGILADDKPAGKYHKYHRPTNQEGETTPTRRTSDTRYIELTNSIKLEEDDIGEVDSQAQIIEKKAFDGTAMTEDQVSMEDVENPNELFKDGEQGLQLRSVQEEPDSGIQRKDGSPKQEQERLGNAYSVTEDVAHKAISRQVAPLDDLQMDGTSAAAAGVRVVFTKPEAEKDGEFYVDPQGNVFRKASRMSHDACQQLFLMEDARHTEDVDCSYQYNHPAHTRPSSRGTAPYPLNFSVSSHRRSPSLPLATQQNALPASSLAKALGLPSVGAPLAAEPETAERRSEPGGDVSTP